jgi:spore coat polysaccharide biosynthesis protein SpsF
MINNSKVGIIVASRFSSSRLPGKALIHIGGYSLLGLLLHRIQTSTFSDVIIVATSEESSDDVIADEASRLGVEVFRGSLSDVVDRYAKVAQAYELDAIVRLTGDNPFVDADYVDGFISQCEFPLETIYTTRPHCPKGLNVEIFSTEMLLWLNQQASLEAKHREHLTSWFYAEDSHYEPIELNLPDGLYDQSLMFTVDTYDEYCTARERIAMFDNSRFSISELLAKL